MQFYLALELRVVGCLDSFVDVVLRFCLVLGLYKLITRLWFYNPKIKHASQ